MINLRYTLVDLVIGAYVLLPLFFKIGPVSVYLILIIGAFVLYCFGSCQGKVWVRSKASWAIRGVLLYVSMLYHGEINAMLVYAAAPGLLCVLLCMYVNSREDIDRLMDVLIYTSVINFLICIIELFTGTNLSYMLNSEGAAVYIRLERLGILRVYGAFLNPINNGIFCIFIQIACLYRIGCLSSQRSKWRIWWIYVCNWVVLFLSFSRASILVALVVNGFLLFKMRFLRVDIRLFISVMVLLAALILLAAVPNSLADKLTETILSFLKIIDDLLGTNMVANIAGTAVVQGVGDRINLYQWVPAAMDNLWFGEGRAMKFSYVVNEFGHTKESIENQYLNELYTHGIVSLAGKIIMFVSALSYALKWAVREWRMKQAGFNTCMLTAYTAYFIMLFTVAQNEEKKVFYIFLVLHMLYNDFHWKNSLAGRKEGWP